MMLRIFQKYCRFGVSSCLAMSCVALASSVSQAQAQQSFSFSFGSSSSFSSGNQTPKEQKSPGEENSTEYPSSAKNGFRTGMSKSVTNVNGFIVEKSFEDRGGHIFSTTRVRNGKQDVLIEESEDIGIKVTLKEKVRGKEKKSEYQADSRKELRKKHPSAFDWVRKYASEPNNANVQAGGSKAAAGAFTGPEAQQMMKQQLEQMIQQTDDPLLKEQLRTLLEQMQNNAAKADR